jgi:hypothetical protein
MLSEKPWKKEFDGLLEKMKALWDGQITSFDDPDVSSEKSLSSVYIYPIYKTTVACNNIRVSFAGRRNNGSCR